MMDFIASLDAEIARLEEAIREIPEVKQLRELTRVRALYDSQQAAKTTAAPSGLSPQRAVVPGYVIKLGGRKPSPERVKAMEFVRELLADTEAPMKTVDILDKLQKNGIEIGGTDEVSNLSAMISGSGEFQAHGRSGWTLKRSQETPQPMEN